MCSICRQNPCHPRCPNYDPAVDTVYTCEECGEGILDGEEYIETMTGYLHTDCASGMTLSELTKALGVDIQIAHKE